ncbi:hypothetical protein WJX84_009538 [Apatococcus fuscideae]|uniref:Helicase Sen1 N-terminal domain-containing protein n=1 Tax=Apatococcus fuscideae TaxID=2026836 RepID=A0AAW1TH55_9CHLO
MSGEQELLARLESAQASGSFDQGWYSDAAKHLQNLDHWWCHHTQLTLGLSTVFSYGTENPAVQHIWGKMAQQLGTCSDCTSHFHNSQEFYHETVDPETAAPLLASLSSLNMARVAATLDSAFSQEGANMSEKLVTALYEALYHPVLLRDEEIMIKLGQALVHLSVRYEMDIAAGHERCPGLYALLTHPDVAVRSLASSAVRSIGAFQTAADVQPVMPILNLWRLLLLNKPDPDGSKLPKERGPFAPSHSAIWTAVAALFGSQGSHLMQPAAMTTVLDRFPDLLDMAVQEASTLGPSARQAFSSLRGVLACIGNQVWAHMSHDACSIIQGCSHVAMQSPDMRVCAPAIQAMAQVVIELQKAGSGMYERPRQLCLDFLTVRLPKSPQALRQNQVVPLATGSAFRAVAIGIDDCIPAAVNGDIYADALVREASGSRRGFLLDPMQTEKHDEGSKRIIRMQEHHVALTLAGLLRPKDMHQTQASTVMGIWSAFLDAADSQQLSQQTAALHRRCIERIWNFVDQALHDEEAWLLAEAQMSLSIHAASLKSMQLPSLAWLAPFLNMGQQSGPRLMAAWHICMRKVLSVLPKLIGDQLPSDARQAAQHLLRPGSTAPNELKLQIGSLLSQEAPGNLGKNPLEGLPSRLGQASSEAHPDLVDLTDSPAALNHQSSSTSPASGQPASRGKLDFLSPSSSHEQRLPAAKTSGTARGQTTPAARKQQSIKAFTSPRLSRWSGTQLQHGGHPRLFPDLDSPHHTGQLLPHTGVNHTRPLHSPHMSPLSQPCHPGLDFQALLLTTVDLKASPA